MKAYTIEQLRQLGRSREMKKSQYKIQWGIAVYVGKEKIKELKLKIFKFMTLKKRKEKKLIYFEPFNSCCENEEYKSQEQLLKERAIIGIAYLADEDADLSKIWGDDWNDAPKCCNAGSPYKETVKGYEEREIRLGDKL